MGEPQYVTVQLSQIDMEDHTFMYRWSLDPGANLVRDIHARGQLSPVFLRPGDDGRYQLISGFRRVSALEKVYRGGDGPVLARIFEEVDDEQAMRMSIAENVQREDYSDLEMVDLVMRLEAGGMPVREMAKLLGVSSQSVYNYRSVGHCDALIKDELHTGSIGLEMARLLSRPENVFPGPHFTLGEVLDRIAAEKLNTRAVSELLSWLKENHEDDAALSERVASTLVKRRGKHRPVVRHVVQGERVKETYSWGKARPLSELVAAEHAASDFARHARAFRTGKGITSSNPFVPADEDASGDEPSVE